MRKLISRCLRMIVRFRPSLKRDIIRQNERFKRKIDRLAEKNRRLKDKVRKLSERMDRLSERIRMVQHRSNDTRYLANVALPREKLRESLIRWWYEKNPDILLNLDRPQTFSEKIQLLKLSSDTPLLTRLVDKYAVRDWVSAKIGERYLVPLLGVWDCAEDVDFDALPQRFVLKANHGSHKLRIVLDKDSLDIPQLRVEMARWLALDFAYVMSPQLQYANVPRKIIAESYLVNSDGCLHDWKVWCFKGKARYVEFMSRKDGQLRFVYMDREWNPAPFEYRNVDDISMEPPPRPHNLDELLRLAETLADGFEFVRVDFYRLDDGAYLFGEMTFSPGGGNGRFDPPEWNSRIGAMFDYRPDNRMPGAATE